MLVLAGQDSLTQYLVTHGCGPGGAGGSGVVGGVVALIVAGDGGDIMDTLGGKF